MRLLTVLALGVRLEGVEGSVRLTTERLLTHERLLPLMILQNVSIKRLTLAESLLARGVVAAAKTLGGDVHISMAFKALPSRKALAALVAYELGNLQMSGLDVAVQVFLVRVCFITALVVADERLLTSVRAKVRIESCLPIEHLVASRPCA